MQDVSDQTYLSRFIMISDSCVNQLLLCWFKNGVFLIFHFFFHFFTKSEVCCIQILKYQPDCEENYRWNADCGKCIEL